MKIGIQLYTVRDAMEKDFEETLRTVKKIGYDYVELSGFYGKSADEVKEIFKEIGIKGISIHQPLQVHADQECDLIKKLEILELSYCAIPWCDPELLKGGGKWEETKQKLFEYSKKLKAAGVQLLYHNHDKELEKVEGKCKLDWLFEELPNEVIEPQFDLGWIQMAGEDPCEYLKSYQGRAKIVHLKDFKGPEQKLCPLGQGDVNIPKLINAMQEAGTEYVFVEQESSESISLIDAARESREYLRTLGL